MSLQHIVAAAAADTLDLVRAVPADRRHAPTPCRDWDVETLTGHLYQVVAALDLAGHGRPVPPDHWQRTCAGATIAPDWAAPPEKVDMSGTVLPGETVVAMLVGDLVLHGWDLAAATGRPYDPDPDAVAMTGEFLGAFAESGRAQGLFGEPVPVAGDAPPLARAVALSGRDPAWTGPSA
jgi:uncharacterized protein (TIGR03086 family)